MSSSPDRISLFQIGTDVLSRPRLLLKLGASVFLLSLVWMLGRTPQYESRATFQPALPSGGVSRLGGLAAQFGLDIGAGGGAGTPDLYKALLLSRPILEALATQTSSFEYRRTWVHPSESISESVSDAIGVSSSDSLEALEEAVAELRSRVQVAIVRESGIVQFRVRLPGPELARDASATLLAEVNAFNIHTRQSQAHAERIFVEERLTIASAALETAEEELRDFLQGNRNDPRASPSLAMEYDRLQREIATAAQVVSSLTQSLEQARIDEVRDTPLITVLEPPSYPTEPTGPSLILRIALAAVFGALVALSWGVGRYLYRSLKRSDPAGFEQFRTSLNRFGTSSRRGELGARHAGEDASG